MAKISKRGKTTYITLTEFDIRKLEQDGRIPISAKHEGTEVEFVVWEGDRTKTTEGKISLAIIRTDMSTFKQENGWVDYETKTGTIKVKIT